MIYLLVIGLVFGLILEPICDAIQDTLDHHQGKSIFSNTDIFENQLWWNSDRGWLNKYNHRNVSMGRVKWKWTKKVTFGLYEMNKPVQFTDAWHFFKALKIILSISAIIITPSAFMIMEWYLAIGIILLVGISRNTVFTMFYHNILIKDDE